MRTHARKLVLAAALISALAPPTFADATARSLNGRIAFATFTLDDHTIWTMNVDGSLKMNLTNEHTGFVQSDPACSPTGSSIAFINMAGNSNGAVAVMDSTGQNLHYVASQEHLASGPAWSPDESKIAYSQLLVPYASALMVADADTYNEGTALTGDFRDPNTGNYAEGQNIQPEWSPDGTKIAFASNRDGDYDIYIVTVATGVITQITNNPGPDLDPSWAPGGGRIAFARFSAGNTDVWLMRPDGSGQVNVTGASPAIEWQPSWSPDGKKIVFTRGAGHDGQVFKMNPDGSGAKLLADHGQTPSWCGLLASPPPGG